MTLINDRVNLMLVICCSALISCNKVTFIAKSPDDFHLSQCDLSLAFTAKYGTRANILLRLRQLVVLSWDFRIINVAEKRPKSFVSAVADGHSFSRQAKMSTQATH